MELSAIILAGGKSSRMGSDKGLIPLKGKPMIQWVIDAVRPITKNINIIANENLEQYKVFGFPVFTDIQQGKGPLTGIYTGLHHTPSENNIVLSCDSPNVSTALIQCLITHHNGYEVSIVKKAGKTHPLIGIYNKSCLRTFKQLLNQNQLKVMAALENVHLNVVDGNRFEHHTFANVNTPSDYENI